MAKLTDSEVDRIAEALASKMGQPAGRCQYTCRYDIEPEDMKKIVDFVESVKGVVDESAKGFWKTFVKYFTILLVCGFGLGGLLQVFSFYEKIRHLRSLIP